MDTTQLKTLQKAYLRSMKVRNLTDRTIEQTQWMLDKFFDYLQTINISHIDHISARVIKDYQLILFETLNAKGRPNSITYQNHMLSTVKNFTRFLGDNDYIVSDPGRKVAYAKAPQKLPRSVLTPAEARKIIKAPDTRTVIGYRDRTILEVLYSSGIRKTELNNLTLSDVDYHDGFLRIIQGKGRKDRMVPIGRMACRYLENYIQSVRPRLISDPYNHHLFLNERGKRFSRSLLGIIIKKYARKAGIKKNVSPHTFRHTCATAMIKNKADICTIQKLLGHSSLKSTQVYTHLSITDLKNEHKRCHPREKDSQ
jgi:integrase/recombinase XerD